MKRLFVMTLAATAALTFSCREERLLSASQLDLRFSADTVFLDTVFGGVNSSTYSLKVYNDRSEPVRISRVYLENQSSTFRLNINGQAANKAEDVTIEAQDSIYIFVEVTAQSAAQGCGSGASFICEDRLLFADAEGSTAAVTLVTEVRDAIFHFPNRFLASGSTVIPYSLINGDETWTPGRPHVIYGYVVVDSGASLTLLPGTNVHFHQNSGLWVFNDGELRSAPGASPGLGDSVTLQGDRLEPAFENIPGQWGGPLGGLFIDGSARVLLNNTVIKNANNAIRTDSALVSDQLVMTNSYVLNSSRTALFGGFGAVDVRNSVFANAGLFLFYGLGGQYEFRHCTFANYWSGSTRSDPAVLLTNFFEFTESDGRIRRLLRDLRSAYFGNCIIDGNAQQEFAIAQDEGAAFDFEVNSALLRLNNDPEDRGFNLSDNSIFQNILVNQQAGFINTDQNNYRLDSNSQVINTGNITDGLSVPTDILGRNRNFNNTPDLGAYERQF